MLTTGLQQTLQKYWLEDRTESMYRGKTAIDHAVKCQWILFQLFSGIVILGTKCRNSFCSLFGYTFCVVVITWRFEWEGDVWRELVPFWASFKINQLSIWVHGWSSMGNLEAVTECWKCKTLLSQVCDKCTATCQESGAANGQWSWLHQALRSLFAGIISSHFTLRIKLRCRHWYILVSMIVKH